MYSLSEQAELDLGEILDWVLNDQEHGGQEPASRLFEILRSWMLNIARGQTRGNRRADVKPLRPLLFVTAAPTRYTIAFDPETRVIARIVHGSRDLPALFKDD